MTGKSQNEAGSAFPAGMSQPSLRALSGAGYTSIDQLTQVSEAELKKLHGMGPKALELLRKALAEKGQTFASGK